MPKSTVVHFCFLADEHIHEAFHLLVVETFYKVGMAVQDFDYMRFSLKIANTYSTKLESRLDCSSDSGASLGFVDFSLVFCVRNLPTI